MVSGHREANAFKGASEPLIMCGASLMDPKVAVEKSIGENRFGTVMK